MSNVNRNELNSAGHSIISSVLYPYLDFYIFIFEIFIFDVHDSVCFVLTWYPSSVGHSVYNFLKKEQISSIFCIALLYCKLLLYVSQKSYFHMISFCKLQNIPSSVCTMVHPTKRCCIVQSMVYGHQFLLPLR